MNSTTDPIEQFERCIDALRLELPDAIVQSVRKMWKDAAAEIVALRSVVRLLEREGVTFDLDSGPPAEFRTHDGFSWLRPELANAVRSALNEDAK